MTEKPTFDPARSEAIRRMLVETVAADQYDSPTAGAARAPRSGPANRRRVGVIVAIAVLAGLVGSGTTALALNGQAWFGASAPVSTAPAPTSAAPDPSATNPAQTSAPPPPSIAANPPAPVIRVPATCEELAPVAASEAVLDTELTTAPPEPRFHNPVSYTDRRLGGLECAWDGGPVNEGLPAAVSLSVLPEVTVEQYAGLTAGLDWGSGTPDDAIAPGTLSSCRVVYGYHCEYLARIGGYGVALSVRNPSRTDLTDSQREAVRALFVDLVGRVQAFEPPAPLWQPVGSTLRGATDCPDFASDTELQQLFSSSEISVFRADRGENDFSVFQAGPTVGAFWCSWSLDRQISATASASVLPGGASYFAQYRAESTLGWAASPGYPGEAWLAEDGGTTYLSILIDGGWVEVSVPTATAADTLPGFAATVLGHVGAE